MTWFGNLDLAYKYTIVFLSLLVFTIAAGVIKVLYDRRQLKNFTKNQENVEAGKRDEQMELNQREKDEGDLFGIRAIEAGFYAGIPQSRPGSSAGSIVGAPSMSSNTLIGSLASPKIQSHSVSSSVTSLPLAHTADRARDSQTLPTSNSPPRRKSPPTIKLRPSEAEMNGRINHSASVNMNLMVPPSPVLARPPQSPHFAGSDDESSDGNASPRSLSPHSANFKPDHYSPVPPQTPMHEGLRASVHHPEVTAKSQAASFNESSPGHSPGHSAPPSPGHTSETNVPTMPAKVYREEPRSLFPAYSDRRDSLPRNSAGQAGAGQATPKKPERSSSPVRLQPQTYQPTHQRDMSDASSVYSEKGVNSHQHKRSNSTTSTFSYNYSFPESSSRNSIAAPIPPKDPRRRSASSSLQAPGSSQSNQTTNDPRFSEFYDAYYRHSQFGVAQKTEAPKRPNQLNLTQPTIVEVPSPMASPLPPSSSNQPGMAL